LSKFKKLRDQLSQSFWLIIREEETLAPRYSTRFNGWKMFAAGFILLFCSFVVSLLLVELFSAMSAKPDQSEAGLNRRLIELMDQVDSLENEMNKKDVFLANMQQVLSGQVPQGQDAQPAPQSASPTAKAEPVELGALGAADSAFRRQFEQEESSTKALRYVRADEKLKNMTFFAPLGGIIMNPFDVKKKHFGVDIVAQRNEPIKAVADGSVIISSWTQDSGHVIGLQHKNQLISFYKHNAVLLKKVGDVVKAGDIVAIIGNSGELTDGPHLHFELWHNGNPVNPEDFIPFSF
jgi:murein DD-endopeptidase MepM/ murein hydrolase activator NlpD